MSDKLVIVITLVSFATLGIGAVAIMYFLDRSDRKRQQDRIKTALQGPELGVKELAEYHGWVMSETSDTKVFEFRKSGADDLSYVQVTEEIASAMVRPNWYRFDVIHLERKLLGNRQAEQREREELERIRQGKSPAESPSSTSESS